MNENQRSVLWLLERKVQQMRALSPVPPETVQQWREAQIQADTIMAFVVWDVLPFLPAPVREVLHQLIQEHHRVIGRSPVSREWEDAP